VDSFDKNYPVYTLENVLSSTVKTFAHTLNILCKQLCNIKSKQTEKKAQYSINVIKRACCNKA